ncbi:protein-L-isoaspartate(D-aspartate) O-methyltransferase [Paraferrimonas sp. SM1919]|uniref:protein-L-isoaspartate(D-aspartate) O-methyltransferase n=1 Tax=Paraferrimonas sp. SM1919 TaxID=2662263 RepID=UPI0013CFA814|nr:protein-L-isoaspartate(D-aspartate) O-methyltransferase [Paraferrimonas sp. SM1919]
MTSTINQLAAKKLVQQLVQLGITDQNVLQVMSTLPRQLFIDSSLMAKAFDNTALPIGSGQTISQPYIVAKMTQLIAQIKPQKVLEIGTGSGYQTAILSQLFEQVYTVERLRELQIKAKATLRKLDCHNIKYKCRDGWLGWSEQHQFDAIIVTAAPIDVPQALLRQLAPGGRLVVPVGEQQQMLYCIERKEDQYYQTAIEPVKFVPLVAEII